MVKTWTHQFLIALTLLLSLPTLANAQDIFLGSGGSDQTWTGVAAGARAGIWMDLGAVGDDTRRDLIVGAPGTSGTSGTVYAIFGGPTRTGNISLSHADAIITSSEAGNSFGATTAAGSILSPESADAPRNLVVGAPGASGGRGAVYLFAAGFPSGTSLTTANAVYTILGAPGDALGSALATGDVDNDGYREIIIGAPGNNRVYIIKGGPSVSGTLDLTGAAPSGSLKMIQAPGLGRVLMAGDVTGDGIYDILMGAPSANLVYLIPGANGAIPTAATTTFFGIDPGDEAGTAIRILDIDADGKNDLVIGAPGADGPSNGRANAGDVYVLLGPVGSGPLSLSTANIVFYGAAAGDRAGDTLATGDINRDTPNDLVINASGAAGGAGELEIYYGRSRGSIGTLQGTQRVVDMAIAGQVNRHIFGDSASGSIRAVQVFEVTGEGARDVIVGVPGFDGDTGKLFFTISPKLRVSRSTVSLTTGAGGTVTSASPINVTNPSVVIIGWQATSNANWLGASPASGSIDEAHPGAFYVVASSAGLAPGTYAGRISVSATSPDLTMTLPVDVTLTVTGTAPGPGTDPSPAPTPTADTRVSINRTALTFGALAGTNALKTGAQSVTVDFSNGSATWTASSNVPWLEVAPSSGVRTGVFSVTVKSGTYSAGANMNGTITVTAPGVANSPLTLPVGLNVMAAGSPPAGVVDTPDDNVTGIVGAVPVTGWAVDDIGIKAVTLWRDPIAGEAASTGNGKIFIGTAGQVEGARPDVDAAFAAPFDYKAGWGYMLLTNMLPNQGNGVFTLRVYAEDTEGHTVLLGSRTITCDNAHATRPFGTIDTPDQGGSTSGTVYTNFGWALTPQPHSIPTDGSTIMVYIDGVPVGHPTYNNNRPDIATLFPGRANTNGAVGYYQFDTTALANGVHTIAWSVTDDGGNVEGIGSRFFTVLNGGTSSSLVLDTSSSIQATSGGGAETLRSADTGSAIGAPAQSVADLPASNVPVYTRSGFDPSASIELVQTDGNGVSHVTTTAASRFALTLGPPLSGDNDGYEGYLVANGRLMALPAGAFLDRRSGDFYWQPGVGFIGTYELVFIRNDGGVRSRLRVAIRIVGAK